MTRQQLLKHLIIDIEQEMRALELWSDEPPAASDLSSTEPFCVDTLCLSDWMQWILIPQMNQLLDKQLPLPNQCSIYVIAEESFSQMEQDCSQLLRLIEKFDQTLTYGH